MKFNVLSLLLSFISFMIIFLALWFLFQYFFENVKGGYKAFICGAVTAILAPRFNILKKQSGKVIQLIWLFLKKPVFI